jgi:ABC-type phosphate transport system substrate-binding protein
MRALLLILCLLSAQFVRAEGLLVIASPQVPADTISTEELAAIYLTQKTAWPGGLPIVPINREAASAVRERFSEYVFERSPRELADYWNRLRFQGKLPPLIQVSDQAIIGFVRSVPGAIGYIDAGQTVTGVKILKRLP